MFYDKNAILVGLIVGFVVPFVGYAVYLLIFEQLEALGWASDIGLSGGFRQRTSTLIALCLNIIPMRFYRSRRAEDSMRGIMIAVAIYAIAWFIMFGKEMF